MNTNIKIELTDDQRNKLYRLWHDEDSNKMVSRKDVVARIAAHIEEELSAGVFDQPEEVVHRDPLGVRRPPPVLTKTAPAFIPSRGDEPYLTQPKDTDVSAACSRILDATAIIEQFAWETIERNRK